MSIQIKLGSWLSIICISTLLVLTGLKGHGQAVSESSISMIANIMYVIFMVTAAFILFKAFKENDKQWIFLFGIPFDLVILSLILPLFGIHFHPIILFLFDVYVLIIFSYYLGYYHHKKARDTPPL